MNRKVIGYLNSDDLAQLQKAEQDFINFAVLAMQSLISCKHYEDNIAIAKRQIEELEALVIKHEGELDRLSKTKQRITLQAEKVISDHKQFIETLQQKFTPDSLTTPSDIDFDVATGEAWISLPNQETQQVDSK